MLRFLVYFVICITVISSSVAHDCASLPESEMESCFQTAVQQNPNDGAAFLDYAALLVRANRLQEASNMFIESTNSYIRSGITAGATTGVRTAAVLLENSGNIASALSLLRNAAAYEPTADVYRQIAVLRYRHSASSFYMEDIRSDIDRCLELASPEQYPEMLRDAVVMYSKQNLRRCGELTLEALNLAADVPAKIQVLELVIHVLPFLDLWQEYGKLLAAQGDVQKASRAFARVAQLAALQFQPDISEMFLKRSHEHYPQYDGFVAAHSGVVSVINGNYAEAVQLLRAAEASGESVLPWLNAAEAKLLQQRSGVSIATGLTLYPSFQQLEMWLSECWYHRTGTAAIEGHINMSGAEFKIAAHAQLGSLSTLFTTVCEIGLNIGHSSVLWLESNPNAVLYSFDLCENSCSNATIGFLQARYGDRFQPICGDSTVTVPKFHQEHPQVKCDILHVDGGHVGEVPILDLKNMRALANEKYHVLVMDDVACTAAYCVDPQIAWDFVQQEGLVYQAGCQHNADLSQGFCYGRYR